MSRRDATVEPVRSRYESKYLVNHRLVGSVRSFIRPFVRPDPFAALQHDLRYPICSLYFDTVDLELCRMTLQGVKNRYKLRVRSYSDDPTAPLFFEVKKRAGGAVLKCRSPMSRELGRRLLSGRATTGPRALPHLPAALEEFTALTTASDARPVLRVKYLREAYESIGPDPVRLTIDTELRHAVTLDPDLSLDGAGWCRTPVEGTILEIKFTERFPSWVSNLVRAFELHQVSVAKYCLSMTSAVERGRYHAPAVAQMVSQV